jgi:hypothetical protein
MRAGLASSMVKRDYESEDENDDVDREYKEAYMQRSLHGIEG